MNRTWLMLDRTTFRSKIFVDAFWNSRAQSFAMHLASLMSSWAVSRA